jgi:outer membrane protein TolC
MTREVTRVAWLILLTVCAARPATAQAPASRAAQFVDSINGLTLEAATAEGLRAQPGVRAARSMVDAARGERRQASERPNPDVSFERREQTGGTDNQTIVMVDLPLDLFRRAPRIAVADRGIDAAEAASHDRDRQLAADIRGQYGEVLAAVRRLELLDAGVDAAQRTHELLRSRAEAGAVPPLDRDLALVDMRRLEGERELAQGRVDVALAMLKQLIGRAPTADLKVRGTLEAAVAAEAPGREATGPAPAADQRPDIREAAARVGIADARLEQARQERKPEVGLFGGYMRMDEGFPQAGFGPTGALEPVHGLFNNVSVGVRLSIPLFSRGEGALAAAHAVRQSAAYTLDERRLAAATEVQAARVRVDAARRAIDAFSGDARTIALRNVDVVRETYSLGRATLFDVLNEQRRYLDFESAYTEALSEMFSARTALIRATGEMK